MIATGCTIRRSTIVEVTKPPLSLWRFHWHELLPIAWADDGNGRIAQYLPEVEPQEGRRALCSRLRDELIDLPPGNGSAVVVEGYLVRRLDDRMGLLPDFQADDLDAFLGHFPATGPLENGGSVNGNSTNGNSTIGGPP